MTAIERTVAALAFPRIGIPAGRDSSDAAAKKVALSASPLWPLASFVAVNPFLEKVGVPFAEASFQLRKRRGARTTMPRSFYREALESGALVSERLSKAASALESQGAHDDSPPGPLVPTVVSVMSRMTAVDWERIATERISTWAGAYFDHGQASLESPFRSLGPYAAWLAEAAIDISVDVLGAKGFRRNLGKLPSDPLELVHRAVTLLGVPEAHLEDYLEAVLSSVSGWASYARYLDWQDGNRSEGTRNVLDVLAIRCAWEIALCEAYAQNGSARSWSSAMDAYASAEHGPLEESIRKDALLHEAYEEAIHAKTRNALETVVVGRNEARASAQLVFCIDVRSEVFRRALERTSDSIETLGFAGFFGLSLDHVEGHGTEGTSLCPVLLRPSLVLREPAKSSATSPRASAWKSFKRSAVSCFSYVSTAGLSYAVHLVMESLGIHPKHDSGPQKTFASRVELGAAVGESGGSSALSTEDRADLAEKMLRAMSLTKDFAPLVVLVGHGATSANNPHAASLDCGACGGNSGRTNAEAAAMVLGDPAIRAILSTRGISIPDGTVFLAGLHDTTTDVVSLFDVDHIAPAHASRVTELSQRLDEARRLARSERATKLDLPHGMDQGVAFTARSRDWSNVRPEWGLAGCVGFVVSGRRTTRGIDLGGTTFLHTYEWKDDPGFATLELIMTAPMVVASWINLQYFASVVEPTAYGSGNKVFHNVVGKLGVLEGHSGDLRSGLPLQSVHDGVRFVHTPAKLAVYIQAPMAAIEGVLAAHPDVRALFENRWLTLFAVDDAMRVSHRYTSSGVWDTLPSQQVG